MTVGKYLKNIIENKGLKQSHVAEMVGMTPQVLGQIMAGRRKIEVSEYYSICVAMGENPTKVAIECGIYAPKIDEGRKDI